MLVFQSIGVTVSPMPIVIEWLELMPCACTGEICMTKHPNPSRRDFLSTTAIGLGAVAQFTFTVRHAPKPGVHR